MKKIIFIILACLLLIVAIGIYMVGYGTPWGKSNAEKIYSSYLENKFGSDVIIEKVVFDFERGNYSAKCFMKVDKNLQFWAYYINGNIRDEYFLSAWEKQINDLLNSKIQVKDVDIISQINWTSNLFNEYETFYKNLPNYFSKQDELAKYTDITLRFSYNFQNLSNESSKIFELLSILKTNVHFENIILIYKNNIYQLSYNDSLLIKSAKDIVTFFSKS